MKIAAFPEEASARSSVEFGTLLSNRFIGGGGVQRLYNSSDYRDFQ